MLNLMYIFEIRKATVLCAFFEIILRHFILITVVNGYNVK